VQAHADDADPPETRVARRGMTADDTDLLQLLKAHAAVSGQRLDVWQTSDGLWNASVTARGSRRGELKTSSTATPIEAALDVWPVALDNAF
jgi:hypothetical protein